MIALMYWSHSVAPYAFQAALIWNKWWIIGHIQKAHSSFILLSVTNDQELWWDTNRAATTLSGTSSWIPVWLKMDTKEKCPKVFSTVPLRMYNPDLLVMLWNEMVSTYIISSTGDKIWMNDLSMCPKMLMFVYCTAPL